MSKKFPECPMYDERYCKHLNNPKVCAIKRKDKICEKKELTKKRKI